MYGYHEDEPATKIEDLHKNIGKQVYLAWRDTGDIWFDSRKYEMEKFFESDECDIVPGDFDDEEVKAYFVYILDPERLPYDLDYSGKLSNREYRVVVLWEATVNNISLSEFELDEMDDVTAHIEDLLEKGEIADLDEVAVLIAKPMKLAITFRETGEVLLEKEIYGD